ncbi:MAG: acetamidase/formamidase family protein, partial [Candidatus Methylomirabilia bacterium]
MSRLEIPTTQKHNRWNRDLPPVAHVSDGDTIRFHTLSADDGQIDPVRPTLAGYDRGRVHPITGPVYVREAEPGDVLEVEVLDVQVGDWGWQMLTRQLAFLRDFVEHETIVVARIDRQRGIARYPSSAEVQLSPMPGIIGVAPAAHGEFRTIPPGPHGRNVDVREVRPGVSLRMPVFVPGALLSVGDVHASQGDGE